MPVVVAINRFKDDTDAEIELIRKRATETGAEDAAESRVWMEGAAGGAELAEAVVEACEKPSNFKFLYPDEYSIKEKIETVAKRSTAPTASATRPRPRPRSSSSPTWA